MSSFDFDIAFAHSPQYQIYEMKAIKDGVVASNALCGRGQCMSTFKFIIVIKSCRSSEVCRDSIDVECFDSNNI